MIKYVTITYRGISKINFKARLVRTGRRERLETFKHLLGEAYDHALLRLRVLRISRPRVTLERERAIGGQRHLSVRVCVEESVRVVGATES